MVVVELPVYVLLHPFRRLYDTRLGLKEQIPLFMIRRTNYLFTPATLRYVTNIGLPETILESPRYKSYSHALFQEFNHPDRTFRGRWIIQGSFAEPQNPQHSDVVVFYLHGGGYFSSSTNCYLFFLLLIAETVIRGGRTVSIFALEYDLAPEYPFPTQLRQAAAAYSWLIASQSEGGVGVNPKRLLLAGDSAGGHLSLSLLVDLQQPYPEGDPTPENLTSRTTASKVAPKPGLGLILISPWLSLWHEPDSFNRNEWTDVLSGWLLLDFAKQFIGPSWRNVWPPMSPYLEFLNPKPEIDWTEVLPGWVWVSAGKNEIMFDDIHDWYMARKKDCINVKVDGELDLLESHVYAWLKTVDYGIRKKFSQQKLDLEIPHTSNNEYEAVERIGKAILDRSVQVFDR